jgi:8-oxo-dGTP diphosphatase
MRNGDPRPTRVALAALLRGDEVYLQRRSEPGGPLDGLWEFPGGKIGTEESGAEAAVREFLEETGGRVAVGELICESFHAYPDRSVALQLFLVREHTPPLEDDRHQYHRLDSLAKLLMPAANRPLVAALRKWSAGRGMSRL